MSYEQDPRNIFVNQRQEYSEKQQTVKEQSAPSNQQQSNSSQTTQQDEYVKRVEEMKRLAAKYEREGEGQLVKDIVNNVIEQKARGQLSNEQLIAFAKRVSPLLNAEQRGRLEGLLEQLLKL
ncbi:MAG: hypothetical protein J1G02_00820 [Clostridiales bacterium]|nr:hypothetical protein [Clostridiales bacterium]